MAKWLGPKVSAEAIHACMILHGHYGYSMEVPLEQRWRDVVGFEIGDGTPGGHEGHCRPRGVWESLYCL